MLSVTLMIPSMDFTNTARYQDATNNIRYPIFFAVFPMKITKTARYHDAANNRFYLHFSRHLLWNSSKRLSTTTLQITRIISFFLSFPMKITSTAQYRDATNNRSLSAFFILFPMKFSETAQYHDATNDKRYLIFSVVFHPIHKSSSVEWCYK